MASNEEVLKMIASSSCLIREAVAASLPVASDQLLTIQIPGTIVDTSENGPYYWDKAKEPNTPHRVRVNEAKLVDGMIPLSKIMMGPSGKSVARSYAAALDTLIPEDAPVDDNEVKKPGHRSEARQAAAARYDTAMTFLKSTGEGGKKVIDLYVEKQQIWTKAMSEWEIAKAQALEMATKQGRDKKEIQKIYDEWNQAHFRNYKNNVQAKYMDWVVNGNKYKVDYHFGIVDISSSMKRVEASKEAARNLVVIDPDGTTEWQAVYLEPQDWAGFCRRRVEAWGTKHGDPTRKEYELEIKRLKRLLLSYRALMLTIEENSAGKELTPEESAKALTASTVPLTDAEKRLEQAYKDLYKLQNGQSKEATTTPEPKGKDPVPPPTTPKTLKEAQINLQAALKAVAEEHLKNNREQVQKQAKSNQALKKKWLNDMIKDTEGQINELENKMNGVKGASAMTVIDETVPNGEQVEEKPASDYTTKYAGEEDKWADAKFGIKRDKLTPQVRDQEPDPWTKISVTVSASKSSSTTEESNQATSASVSYGSFFWGASASASYSSAQRKAAQSAQSCTINISFSAMLVNIIRPWLHGELFSDPELNVGQGVKLSPGPANIKEMIEAGNDKRPLLAEFQQFPSYPTAFVVASDIELEFVGDTSSLEDAVESTSVEANAKVDYGCFSLGASHKQDKSKSSTKMETTSTGVRISLEAPAIIGWVSSLLPELPRHATNEALLGVTVG